MKEFLRSVKRTVHQASAPGSVFTWRHPLEQRRLAALPRYVATTTQLPGAVFKIPNGPPVFGCKSSRCYYPQPFLPKEPVSEMDLQLNFCAFRT